MTVLSNQPPGRAAESVKADVEQIKESAHR
jgi:hypothetical protein